MFGTVRVMFAVHAHAVLDAVVIAAAVLVSAALLRWAGKWLRRVVSSELHRAHTAAYGADVKSAVEAASAMSTEQHDTLRATIIENDRVNNEAHDTIKEALGAFRDEQADAHADVTVRLDALSGRIEYNTGRLDVMTTPRDT